jgi:hypothetical protein
MLTGEQAVDTAIAQVLDAERAAQAELATARSESSQAVDCAHREAQRIAERGEAKVVAVRRAVEARVARREAEVAAQIARLRSDRTDARAEVERVQRAVAAVAAELTQAGP